MSDEVEVLTLLLRGATEDRDYAQADARHWHEAWERTDEQLRLAIRREAHKSAPIDAARELVPLVRYHALHSGVSPQDRARIAALCDEIDGSTQLPQAPPSFNNSLGG